MNMKELYGWSGKILRVDLTKEKIVDIETAKYIDLIGGVGIAAKIFFDEVPLETGPFDVVNQLSFMTGPLTGTMIPGVGRGTLCAKSPLPHPNPAWTYSGYGGGWPAELKFAGYDGIIIEGKSDTPVYLLIHDEKREIRNASNIWGCDSFETQKKICQQVDDAEIKSMVIGPAGENLVHMSIVMNETASAAGYGGMGAVMGSKKLKAIAVRGTGNVRIAKPDELLPLLSSLRKSFGFKGVWEFDNEPFARGEDRYGRAKSSKIDKKYFKHLDNAGPGAASKGYHLHNSACFGCYLSCKGFFSYPGLPAGTAHCGQWWFASIRSPTNGGISAADENSWLANILANKLGLNIFENQILARWFKDCIQEGIINEKDIPLPDWLGGTHTDKEFITNFLYKLAHKEGFLARFADGVMNGAEALGPRALYLLRKYTTARGIKRHHDTPLAYLIWAMDSRDPYNSVHDDNAINYRSENSMYHLGFDASNPWSYNTIPKTAIKLQHSKDLKNSLPLCDWCYPLISKDPITGQYSGRDFPAQLFSVVTGIEVDEAELEKYGERITNIQRAIMVTESRTIEDDTVNELRFQTPIYIRRGKGEMATLNKEKFQNARREYYKLRGWNTSNGRPTAKKLDELGLSDVRIKLDKMGLIPPYE